MLKIDIPEYISVVIEALENEGFEVYLVGGCVRDSILNQEINDYDLATNANIDELLKCLNDFRIINNGGIKHNTITVRIEDNNIEISSFKRNDDEPNTIEIDLSHRDLAINSMAYNIKRGFIDPYGGIESINNRILFTPIDPYINLKEDYLRILRVLRFSSKLDYDISIETKNAIKELYYGLNNISVERIKKELDGILSGKRAKEILLEYSDVICTIIPELKPCVGFNQNNKYHIHDVYEHTAYVVGYSENILNVRIAALLHDIAKPLCYSEDIRDGKVCGHFYHHPEVGANIAKEILKRLKYKNSDIEEIYYLIKYHDNEIAYTEKSVKKIMAKAPGGYIDSFRNLIYLKIADRLDHINLEPIEFFKYIDIAYDIISANACLSLKDLAINGNDLIDLGYNGVIIGQILNDVLNKIINNQMDNNKVDIINYIKKMY